MIERTRVDQCGEWGATGGSIWPGRADNMLRSRERKPKRISKQYGGGSGCRGQSKQDVTALLPCPAGGHRCRDDRPDQADDDADGEHFGAGKKLHHREQSERDTERKRGIEQPDLEEMPNGIAEYDERRKPVQRRSDDLTRHKARELANSEKAA